MTASTGGRFPTAAALAVAAAILTLELLLPPIIGLANNGDFDRVMSLAGLDCVDSTRAANFVNWVVPRFRIVAPLSQPNAYVSSETLLAIVAVRITRAVTTTGFLDIRALGGIHVALLLCAIGLMVRSTRDLPARIQWLVAVLVVFMFTDVG